MRGQTTYLYLAVFTGGMTTLAVELSASRLIGNVFGSSNLVWANVIGLMLLYLTIGYFIGGRWADRSPNVKTLYRIFVWSGFLVGVIPLIARPVAQTAARAVFVAEANLAIGSFITILILFAIPVTLLGCVSPFAIRLAVDDPQRVGQTAGQIYAISTLGSLIGTFLPVLFLIPQIGTFETFLCFSAALYLVGWIGLWRFVGRNEALRWLWMPVVIGLAALLILRGPLRAADEGTRILYEGESAYNYLQVQEDATGYRYLYLNEGQGVHSVWHPTQILFNGTWDLFLAAPYFNAPPFTPDQVDSLLVIGLAAGTIPHQYIEVYGDIPIDGVEIDPEIIAIGQQFFGMDAASMPSLTTYAQDGRFILNTLEREYSVIAIDAYRPPYIPWHLTTVEFFQEVRAHLQPDGVMAINVGRTDTDRRLIDAFTNTLLHVFPSVHAVDVPGSFNTLLIATQQPTRSAYLADNLAALPTDASPILRTVLQITNQALVEIAPSDILFTDNRAPIEPLIDSLVLNFLLFGDVDQIR